MIIGKTRLGLEKTNSKPKLTKNKYYNISHLSREFLLKNNVNTLPVNLNNLIKNNGWKTIPYSKLKSLNFDKYTILMTNNSGFSELRRNNTYYIYYDDTIDVTIQRFTVAHEIGHILLNHFTDYNNNREQEANMIATRILMPMCILYECKVKDPYEIQKICNVSIISATYRFNRLQMLIKRKKFYTDKNELLVKKQFKNFIKEYIRIKN